MLATLQKLEGPRAGGQCGLGANLWGPALESNEIAQRFEFLFADAGDRIERRHTL